MPAPRLSVFISSWPWTVPERHESLDSGNLQRGFVTLPFQHDSQVICDETRDPLPLAARWVDAHGNRWSKYELPRGESHNVKTLIHFDIGKVGEHTTVEVPLGEGVSRSHLDEILDSDDPVPPNLRFYEKLRNMVDQHIHFMNDLVDHIYSNRYYWEGNCRGLEVRPVIRAVRAWRKAGEKDSARLALIVKLAREYARLLGQVCESPRVVLRRSREFQNLSRIQEIDAACLRWIARQPGRDIYERAGSRQQLLGVVRKEDTDTLENRVVRDLLHRARVECSNYLSLYREFEGHDRVRMVRSFRHKIVDWQQTSEIGKAKSLTGPVQPNYVLLHEQKYRKLWDAYQALIAQQKQKDDIWKWRDRTFSECCQMIVLAALAFMGRDGQGMKSDVVLQHVAISGTFVSHQTELGFFSIQGDRKRHSVLLCPGHQAFRCPWIDRSFYPLSADFYLVEARDRDEPRILPFWCFSGDISESLSEGVELLEGSLANVAKPYRILPKILVYEQPAAERKFFGGRGEVVNVANPMQQVMEFSSMIINGMEVSLPGEAR